jgi:PilZ domain
MALLRRQSRFDARKDDRAQRRTRIDVQGTIYLPEKTYEEKCLVLDLSPDGAGLKSTCTAVPGTHVVLVVHGLGRYGGILVRHDRIHVGVQFKYSEVKRQRVAETIAAYLEHGSSYPTLERTHTRVAPGAIQRKYVLESGESNDCEITDIALSGIAFKAAVRPSVGARLFFGKSAAVVVRHTKEGFAVVLSGPREPKQSQFVTYK